MSASIEQLTAGVTGPALLATGVPVEIFVARPDDLESVRTFYEELSDTSTYFRFFGIRRALPDDELRSVVTPCWPERLTLCAAVDGRLIGVGELVSGSPEERAESGDAELAFAVADDHHREGVATLLLEALAIVARRSGLPRLTAQTMPGNYDMLLVFRTVGLAEQSVLGDDGIIHITLDLASLDVLEANAAERRRHSLDARRNLAASTDSSTRR